MTPVEYTLFRDAVRTDYPDLYQYLPNRFDLLQWQEFVERLLEKLNTALAEIRDREENIEELKADVADLEREIIDLRDRLDDYED